MNPVEREAVGLCVCIDALNDIVNHSLVELREVSVYSGEFEVYFHDSVHKNLFLIRTLDFVKESGDIELTGVRGSCIDVLGAACSSANFDIEDSVSSLKNGVENIREWLSHRSPVKMWLPDLDINAELHVSRYELLHIAGNYAKHNRSRLTGVGKEIYKLLINGGYEVEPESIPFTLDYLCQEHLIENYFIYYCTSLTEQLNELRWSIHEYLYPAYRSAYVNEDGFRYRFEYPESISSENGKRWFRDMMNGVRKAPYLRRFRAARYLKGQSSLEKGFEE